MASSSARTVSQYLAELPADRRAAIKGARALVRRHMPKGYKEAMGYGMITWTIPLSMYVKAGKRFDMGKPRLHFKALDDLVAEPVSKCDILMPL